MLQDKDQWINNIHIALKWGYTSLAKRIPRHKTWAPIFSTFQGLHGWAFSLGSETTAVFTKHRSRKLKPWLEFLIPWWWSWCIVATLPVPMAQPSGISQDQVWIITFTHTNKQCQQADRNLARTPGTHGYKATPWTSMFQCMTRGQRHGGAFLHQRNILDQFLLESTLTAQSSNNCHAWELR